MVNLIFWSAYVGLLVLNYLFVYNFTSEDYFLTGWIFLLAACFITAALIVRRGNKKWIISGVALFLFVITQRDSLILIAMGLAFKLPGYKP